MAGDTITEEWRLVVGYPDYEVSNLGRVRRATDALWSPHGSTRIRSPRGYILKPHPNGGGYLTVRLSAVDAKPRSRTVHILVCTAFHGKKPTPAHEVAHSDDNGLNPVASNLRWATQKENSADRDLRGRTLRGSRHPAAKLNEGDIQAIRGLVDAGKRTGAIASLYGVGSTTISMIKSRSNWGWLD